MEGGGRREGKKSQTHKNPTTATLQYNSFPITASISAVGRYWCIESPDLKHFCLLIHTASSVKGIIISLFPQFI